MKIITYGICTPKAAAYLVTETTLFLLTAQGGLVPGGFRRTRRVRIPKVPVSTLLSQRGGAGEEEEKTQSESKERRIMKRKTNWTGTHFRRRKFPSLRTPSFLIP